MSLSLILRPCALQKRVSLCAPGHAAGWAASHLRVGWTNNLQEGWHGFPGACREDREGNPCGHHGSAIKRHERPKEHRSRTWKVHATPFEGYSSRPPLGGLPHWPNLDYQEPLDNWPIVPKNWLVFGRIGYLRQTVDPIPANNWPIV